VVYMSWSCRLFSVN